MELNDLHFDGEQQVHRLRDAFLSVKESL